MKHGIHIEGHRFALRPVERADAALIVRLRGDPERSRFLHPIVPTLAAQEAYLDDYFARPGEYYFAIERKPPEPVGLIALYDVDRRAGSAEMGRWIIAAGSLAAVESALLIYRVAFERLGLDEVFTRVVADNRRALSFQDSCGLERRALRREDCRLGDQVHDQVEHVLTRERWPSVRTRLAQLARAAA